MEADGVLLSTERFIADALLLGDRWTDKPSSGGWSPAEVTEHVAIADKLFLGILTHALEPLDGPATDVADDEIPYLFFRDSGPGEAGDPTGTWTDPIRAVESLAKRAEALATWERETGLDLRAHGLTHPAFGTLDAAQWLRFAQAHTERHRAELFNLRKCST